MRQGIGASVRTSLDYHIWCLKLFKKLKFVTGRNGIQRVNFKPYIWTVKNIYSISRYY
jgi:hypothetical protein